VVVTIYQYYDRDYNTMRYLYMFIIERIGCRVLSTHYMKRICLLTFFPNRLAIF